MSTPTISKEVDSEVRAISEVLLKIVKEKFPELRVPVIAGGAIRDGVMGKSPKDYDIFIDLSPYESPEEAEDKLLLVALALGDEMERNVSEATGEKAERYSTDLGNPDDFCVYNIRSKTPVVQGLLRAFVGGEVASPYQLIGRMAPELSKDPLDWVTKTFDYSMVKALFDPLTGEYKFAEEFLEAWNSKHVEFPTGKAYDRAYYHFNYSPGWTMGLKGRSADNADPFAEYFRKKDTIVTRRLESLIQTHNNTLFNL